MGVYLKARDKRREGSNYRIRPGGGANGISGSGRGTDAPSQGIPAVDKLAANQSRYANQLLIRFDGAVDSIDNHNDGTFEGTEAR